MVLPCGREAVTKKLAKGTDTGITKLSKYIRETTKTIKNEAFDYIAVAVSSSFNRRNI